MNSELIWDWVKDNAEFLVVVATFLVTVYGIYVSKKQHKEDLRLQLENKKAELNSINEQYFGTFSQFVDSQLLEQARVRKNTLEKEISAIKKQLK